MRPKPDYRGLAEQLRRQGLSLSEIQKQVPVAKSSLSLWLRNISLTVAQQKRLNNLNTMGQQAGAVARRQQRIVKLEVLREEVLREVPSLLANPFFSFGLALYAAEGTKQKPWNISALVRFSNSDHTFIIMMREWLQKFCKVRSDELSYRLYIHKTANIEVARNTWAQLLAITAEELPVTIKQNNSKFRHNTLREYKGLVQMQVRKSTWLNRRIELWTQGAATYFLQ